MSTQEFEFGLDSFGEVSRDSAGRLLSDAETVRLMISEAVLAESVGINAYNIGEHYRPGHVDSAGHVILAGIAGRTERRCAPCPLSSDRAAHRAGGASVPPCPPFVPFCTKAARC